MVRCFIRLLFISVLLFCIIYCIIIVFFVDCVYVVLKSWNEKRISLVFELVWKIIMYNSCYKMVGNER